ncbi:hypothetical protein GX411_08030 [Candidatus Fermentibacteria bacterium]|nr:hypothetical protein [Candidatus Fermentibacteria bacterium]
MKPPGPALQAARVSGYLARTLRPAPPGFVFIEPTNRCNLSYPMCSRDPVKRPAGFMDMGAFDSIAEQLIAIRPPLVTLHLAGEPMLHPGLFDMVKRFSSAGIDTTFSTNGTLLAGTDPDVVFESGLTSMRFDFTPDRQRFEEIRRGASWESVRDGMAGLLAARRARGLCRPVIVLNDLGNGDCNRRTPREDWTGLFDGCVPDVIEPFQAHEWAGSFPENPHEDCPFELPARTGRPKACSLLWFSTVIAWDGRVLPCCRDLNAEHPLGAVSHTHTHTHKLLCRRSGVAGRIVRSGACTARDGSARSRFAAPAPGPGRRRVFSAAQSGSCAWLSAG